MKLKRIFHIADVHIRNIKRHKEYRLVFDKMFEEIRKHGTDDSIIYLAGDIAHAKLEMSPELIKEISWLFTECTKHCPTILIAGNHDCNMNNTDRLDVLTPIVEALNLPNFYYLKNTQVWGYGDTAFGVFSIFDNKDNWPKADDAAFHTFDKKIALFHGPVDNSQTDIGYVVSSRHFTTDMFDGYDLALLGDIHKRQELISPKGCKVVYAGSLVQQNFGETVDTHGFLVWDLDTMTYKAIDIKNDYGYYTLNVDNGIVPDVDDMPTYAHLRVKLSNTDSAITKKVVMEIKRKYKIKDFSIIRTDSVSKMKTGNRKSKLDFDDVTDVNYQNHLINDYMTRMFPHLCEDDLRKIETINIETNTKIKSDDIQRNIFWKPIRFEFSNMFSYGEDNKIDFTQINGLTGLFAPNASGKSSLFDAISFCLYDKCSRAFKATHIMNNRKTSFWCQLDFEVNGILHSIRREARTVNKGKNVKVDVQFWRIVDGQVESLNGTERRDTNAEIEQYVGRYEDFVLTSLSLQGNNALFIDKSQSERKELLAQFMGINVFDKLYDVANDDIKEVNFLIKNFKKVDFTSELNDKILELDETKNDISKSENDLTGLSTSRDSIIEKIFLLNKELSNVSADLDITELNRKKLSTESELTAAHLSLESNLKDIENLKLEVDAISKKVESNETINGISINDAKRELDELKSSMVSIAHNIDLLKQSIKLNKEKLTHLEKHEYDPNCSYCMNNVFVKDAISTKEKVDSDNDALTNLLETLNEYKVKHESIKHVDTVWNTLISDKSKQQKLISELGVLVAEAKSLKSKKELLTHKLTIIDDNIKTYYLNETIIKRNRDIENEIKELNVEKASIDLKIKDVSKMLSALNSKLSTIESYIQGCKDKIKEVQSLEEKYHLYECYLDAIKKDGIPYELISKALPIIESEVNNILGQVVDFNIVMDVDGKNINAKIVYDDQEWALEMSSGMERFISGLAIRVALINICNLPRPNFLVIDEGFGTLDSDNISSLFMMMQYLKTQFDFIWIISHLDQMRDMVDGIVEIKKIGGYSSIRT